MHELPDPNAGDDLAYEEAWDDRIRDDEQDEPDEEVEGLLAPLENRDEI